MLKAETDQKCSAGMFCPPKIPIYQEEMFLWGVGEAQLVHHWAPILTSTTLMLPRFPLLSTSGSETLTLRGN